LMANFWYVTPTASIAGLQYPGIGVFLLTE
jgi:hypothetical protein